MTTSDPLSITTRLYSIVRDGWTDADVDLDFPNGGYKPREGRRYISFAIEPLDERLVSTGPPKQYAFEALLRAEIADVAGEGFGTAGELATALNSVYFQVDRDNLTFFRLMSIPREIGGNDTHTAFEYSVRFVLFYYVD